MNESEWKAFLAEYNRELLSCEEVVEVLPREVIKKGMAGLSPLPFGIQLRFHDFTFRRCKIFLLAIMHRYQIFQILLVRRVDVLMRLVDHDCIQVQNLAFAAF